MSTPDSETPSSIDLTNCDREPIHTLGAVQSFGCLIAVSSDWIVLHVSANIEAFFGVTPDAIIGTPLQTLVSEQAIHDLRSRLQYLAHEDAVERIFGFRVRENSNDLFDVGMHISGRAIVFEFERHAEVKNQDHGAYVRPMIERLKKARTVEELCRMAAKQVRALTGFDRVMVYKFHPDETGEVIAESARTGIGSFLGQRYPASDIPQQARLLYKRNLLRIISDVNDPTAPIVPRFSAEGEPLDLTFSGLRAVSKIHIEYLSNMGVEASMSISILKRGKLWGLFACHHYAPRILGYDVRSAAELFGQLFAFIMDQIESDQAREEAARARTLHDQLMAQLAEGSTIQDNFEMIVDALATVIPFDGAVCWVQGRYQTIGDAPGEEQFLRLARFLNTAATGRVFQSESIHQIFPPAEEYASNAAGLLALPVSRAPRDYIVLFRKEVAKTVKWAGNPDKPAEYGPNGSRLTPRKSFEAWQAVVRGHSDVWTEGQVQTAEALRVTLLEVVLRMSDAAHRDRQRSQERQELLIAELNHRVRNILNLIRGLVNQSRSEARSVSEFTETVGGRIHALARAHDQITQQSWNASPLKALIRSEVEAYLGAKVDRVRITGEDVMLKPEAFTTLALVFHELTTNSAKYGAFSDSRGAIDISLEQSPDDALMIKWQESGGPPVKAPTRRGFGTTVIERSIPYELRGTAELFYDLNGLRAEFRVPGLHITEFMSEDAKMAVKPAAASAPVSNLEFGGPVLILEDNMIISLDAEDIMREIGADDVQSSSTVEDALRLIKQKTPALALLDVNLGVESSEPVARLLTDLGAPFAFATGYGDAATLVGKFPHAPVIPKPYSKASIIAAVAPLLARAKESGG